PLDVDQAGVALGAVADELVGPAAGEIDAHRDTRAHIRVRGVDQALARVELGERRRIELRIAAAKAHLRQPRAFAHQYREGTRADLGIERAVIARPDLVEAAGAIDDDTGEYVETAGRAFRIGGRAHGRRQREALDERHDVDASGFEHRAVGKVYLVQ